MKSFVFTEDVMIGVCIKLDRAKVLKVLLFLLFGRK